jgi:flagellar motility protein MotE (MotC chaperone)
MSKTVKRQPKRNSEVRILPAAIGVGAILFALKAGGLAFGAKAAEAESVPPAPAAAAPAPKPPANMPFAPAAPAQRSAAPAKLPAQPTTPIATTSLPAPEGAAETPPAADTASKKTVAPAASAATALPDAGPDPLAAINHALPNQPGKSLVGQGEKPAAPDTLPSDLSGTGVTPAEMDVLTSLSERRDALDQRQRELDLQANMLAATEKRVDGKIAQLKTLQTTIERLMGQRDAKETEQLDGLVKIYTAMKPKDAARIFQTLDSDVRIGVAGRMKPDTMAGIMSSLPADVAQKMTVDLASRYKMTSEMAQAAAAAATSATTPAAPATPPRPAGN